MPRTRQQIDVLPTIRNAHYRIGTEPVPVVEVHDVRDPSPPDLMTPHRAGPSASIRGRRAILENHGGQNG